MTDHEKATGSLLGLACGDALGRPVEFRSPAAIEREHGTVTEMLGHGTHGQPAGTITDDTEMALCIARSLAERERFDPDDVARRFVEWYDGGPFDIGGMTSQSISRLKQGRSWDEAGQQVWERSHEGGNAGNGSVMRCAPHALAFADDPAALDRVSRRSSRITHADPRCTAGCAVLNATIAGLLGGEADPLTEALAAVEPIPDELRDALEVVPEGVDPAELQNTGYVVTTLQAGLHHGLTTATVEDAIVDAVAMGGDSDTIGAVTGAVAGARFGADALPERWLRELACRDELTALARTLATTKFEA
ncbi:ADP-ribosylglycohydrolase family protein [Halomarina salina]|uniref:ADP-ribosylglycohydrolase family protein n=1 Tax=Halomarina salina TaxID=1872699 RepID=A0ABD5RMS9_9EURY|nr:ADP-ribosylglycohydrolase family protein [Halomarina salina]